MPSPFFGAFLGLATRPANIERSAPLEAEMRARLAERFEPHNRELFELLGHEFAWTRP